MTYLIKYCLAYSLTCFKKKKIFLETLIRSNFGLI